jgi:hypothetical protein
MNAHVPELAARRPDREPHGLTSIELSALVARGRRLHAEAFNRAIDRLVARLRHLVH